MFNQIYKQKMPLNNLVQQINSKYGYKPNNNNSQNVSLIRSSRPTPKKMQIIIKLRSISPSNKTTATKNNTNTNNKIISITSSHSGYPSPNMSNNFNDYPVTTPSRKEARITSNQIVSSNYIIYPITTTSQNKTTTNHYGSGKEGKLPPINNADDK